MAQSDVVMFMNISLVGIGPAIAAGRPIVATHHGCYRGVGLRGTVLEGLKRALTWFVPNIACSKFVAAALPGHCTVVANALSDDFFRDIAPREKASDFVFCGRLVREKGADLLIRAFAGVVDKVPGARLTIVGSGPERVPLENLVTDLRISHAVRFSGSLFGQHLVDELSRHAYLVVPSVWEEPFGIVALEGIARCEAVIATNRGGLPEAVGECGLLVEPNENSIFETLLLCANARAVGAPLPGRPDDRARAEHLARHRLDLVAADYLRVLQKAVDQS